MQDSNTSLSQLHDIFIPHAIGFEWREGHIWLALLLATVLLSLLYPLYECSRNNLYKKEALKALKTAATPAEIFEILKRVLLTINPREEVASLSGAALLQRAGLAQSKTLAHLAQGVYNPKQTIQTDTIEDAKKQLARWIREQKG